MEMGVGDLKVICLFYANIMQSSLRCRCTAPIEECGNSGLNLNASKTRV